MRGVCSTMRRFTMVCLPKLLQMNHKKEEWVEKTICRDQSLNLNLLSNCSTTKFTGFAINAPFCSFVSKPKHPYPVCSPRFVLFGDLMYTTQFYFDSLTQLYREFFEL